MLGHHHPALSSSSVSKQATMRAFMTLRHFARRRTANVCFKSFHKHRQQLRAKDKLSWKLSQVPSSLPRIKRRLIENSRLFMRTVWHSLRRLACAWLDFHFLSRRRRCVFPLCAFSMQQCQHGFDQIVAGCSKSHLKINAMERNEKWQGFLKVPAAQKFAAASTKWKLSDNGAFINMGNFCIKWAVKKTKARKCFYLPCCKCTEYIEYY